MTPHDSAILRLLRPAARPNGFNVATRYKTTATSQFCYFHTVLIVVASAKVHVRFSKLACL